MTVREAHPAAGTKAVRYDGSACLNLRSINQAIETLSGKRRGEPMPREELASLLWFVEICVNSKDLYFDGTLPTDEVTAAQETIGEFLRQHAIPDVRIDPIAFSHSTDILGHAATAIVESSLIINELTLTKELDSAVKPKEHETFFQLVLAEANWSDQDRQARALEMVEQRFRGSKCLAGLVSAGRATMADVRRLYEKHADQGSLVTAALINRFRLNYLNELASFKRGAYVPDPNFETITDQHVRLFGQYLAQALARQARPRDDEVLAESLSETTPLPPIGLYALMLTRDRGAPVAVLLTAMDQFRSLNALRDLVAAHTRAGMNIQQRKQAVEESRRQIDNHFLDAYRALETGKGIERIGGVGEKLKKYIVPALLSTVAGLVAGPVGVGAVALVSNVLIETATSASASAIGDALLGEGVNSYIAQYRTLRFALLEDPALAQPAGRIADQVQAVFGRTLT